MAKKLLLLRHAKSSWDDTQLDDHDRPLNARGRKAATRMGQLFNDESFVIGLVLCSTSVRTRETAARVFAEYTRATPPIEFHPNLYHASPAQLAASLKQVVEPTSCVLLIGHNPGLEEFVGQFTDISVEFPTAALALIELHLDNWQSFEGRKSAELKQLWRPRDLDRL